MTSAETDALKWLNDRGGDGVFAERNRQVLLARGERGPFMRSTWNSLVQLGALEFYGNHRLRVVNPERKLP